MTEVTLVGYGTLLYRASLSRTIGDSAHEKAMHPVAVPDFRRLFNLRPDHYEPSHRLSPEGIEAGAMNVEPAADAWFNGLAFRVAAQELERLDRRERYYRRLPVRLLDFATREPMGEGFVYSVAPDSPRLERRIDRLLPRWDDIAWAREGAFAITAEFGRAFDETTFLADGRTLVAERYRDLLDPATKPGAAADGAR